MDARPAPQRSSATRARTGSDCRLRSAATLVGQAGFDVLFAAERYNEGGEVAPSEKLPRANGSTADPGDAELRIGRFSPRYVSSFEYFSHPLAL